MKVLAVANNPGGANAIVPVIHRIQNRCIVVAEGFAKEIFKKEGIPFLNAEEIIVSKVFKEHEISVMLSGTSAGKTIDKQLLAEAKQQGIISVYVLDFWANYWGRFSEDKDVQQLPDYICVMDERAKKDMINEDIPVDKIIVTGNPFFDHFIENIGTNAEEEGRLLFISQPFTGATYGYTEQEVLRDIIQCVEGKINLEVRLHPRDDKNKYRALDVQYDDISILEESVSKAKVIIGMNSMVLFQSAVAGKRVISYQPSLTNDILPSNGVGLSTLVTSKNELCSAINDALYTDRQSRAGDYAIIKNATENVVAFIHSL